MAATDDFFISFGSNAKSFTTHLKRELGEAQAFIRELTDDLGGLDNAARTKLPPFINALRQARAEVEKSASGGSGSGSGGGGNYDAGKFNDVVDSMAGEMAALQKQLTRIVVDLAKVAPLKNEALTHERRSQAQQASQPQRFVRVNEQGKTVFATADAPGAFQRGAVDLSRPQPAMLDPKVFSATLAANLNRALSGPQIGFGQVSGVQIDSASMDRGFDRVVAGLKDVRDEVRKLRKNGTRVSLTGEEVPADAPRARRAGKTPKAAADQATTAAAAVAQADDAAVDTIESLRADLIRSELTRRSMAAIQKRLPEAAAKALEGQIEAIKQAEIVTRQKLAELERAGGKTARQRSSENRAQAESRRSRKDMPAEEYDRIKRLQTNFDLALTPDAFRESVGKGSGKLKRAELVEMIDLLNQLGIATKKSGNVPELIDRILAGRSEMTRQYGAGIPEQLRLGKRQPQDKLDENLASLIGSFNIAESEREMDRQARETWSVYGKAGYAPKDPTLASIDSFPRSRLLQSNDLPSLGFGMSEEMQNLANVMGQLNTSSRNLSEMWTSSGSVVRTPQGPVKGGSFDPEMLSRTVPFQGSEKFAQQVSMGLAREIGPAAPMSRDTATDWFREGAPQEWLSRALRASLGPGGFDPREFTFAKGQGEAAQQQRTDLSRLIRATDSIDDLAREYNLAVGARTQNEEFIQRAVARMEKGTQRPDDRERVLQAQGFRERLQGDVDAFAPALQKIFSSPAFLEGFEKREAGRVSEAERLKERADAALLNGPAFRNPDVRDAAGNAFINRRLAGNTQIQDIPGLRYNQRSDRFDFVNPENFNKEQHAALDQANKYWRSYRRAHQKIEDAIPDARERIDAGENILEATGTQKSGRREQNQATRFLNSIQKLMGVSQPIENLLAGSGLQERELSEKNRLADERRRAATAAVSNVPFSGKAASDDELLSMRLANLAEASGAYATALERAKAATDKVRSEEGAVRQALNERLNSLGAAERAEYDAARTEAEVARANANAITNRSARPLSEAEVLKRLQVEGGPERDETGRLVDPYLRDAQGRDLYALDQIRRPADVVGGRKRDRDGNFLETEEEFRKRQFEPFARRLSGEKSLAETTADANRETARGEARREAVARQRMAAILGEEATATEQARREAQELADARDDARRAQERATKQLIDTVLEQARNRVGARDAKLRELERVGESPGAVREAFEKREAAAGEYARLQNLAAAKGGPAQIIAEQQAKADAAAARRAESSTQAAMPEGERQAKAEARANAKKVAAAEKRLADINTELAAARERAAQSTKKSGLSEEQLAKGAEYVKQARRELSAAQKDLRTAQDAPLSGAPTIGPLVRSGDGQTYAIDDEKTQRTLDAMIKKWSDPKTFGMGSDRSAGMLGDLMINMPDAMDDFIGALHGALTDVLDPAKLGGTQARDTSAEEARVQAAQAELDARQKALNDLKAGGVPAGTDDGAVAEVERLEQAAKEAAAELARLKAAAKKPTAAGGAVDSAELADMKARLDRANQLAGQLKRAKAAVKKAEEEEDEAALKKARRRRDRARNDEGYLGQTARRELGRQIRDAEAGGAGAGAGGTPPTARGGAGGFGEESNNILRQILAAIEGTNTLLRGGLKVVGGGQAVRVDEHGNPLPPKPRPSRAIYPPPGEAEAARGGDPEAAALAAAAQRRRIELIRQAQQSSNPNILAGAQAAAQSENKQRAEQAKRAASMTVQQAQAQLQLDAAYEQVDAAARKELDTLRRLNAEGADSTKIALQQARAIAAIDTALTKKNFSATQRRYMGLSLLNDQRPQNARGEFKTPEMDAGAYQEAAKSAYTMFGPRLKGAAADAGEQGRDALASALFGDRGFWGRIMGSTGAFIVRNFTAGFVFGLTNALQEVVYQGIVTESTWIRVSDALEQTGRSAGSLRTDLQAISADYGVALNDVYMTAAGLAGVFDDVSDISSATRVVAQLQQISMGALNAQEAMGVLASITGAYKDELREGADGLTQVADVLTVVQNTIGTNVETTAEGVGALSGLAERLKIPFEEMSVYVAQIAKLTNQTGAAAGEQFSRILASMQTGRGRSALTEALPDSGIGELLGSGEYGQAIQVLMREWDGLSEKQQNNLAVTIAGQRQARAFAALMSNTGKTLEATARAHDANGQAAARAAAIANTLNGLLSRLNANFQNLAQNLIRTGILDAFGLILGVANQLLEWANKFLSTMNDLTDGSPLLSMLKSWTFGLLGFIAAMKVAGMAIRGFRASLAELRTGEGVMAAGVQGAIGGRGERLPGVRQEAAGLAAGAYGRAQSRADDLQQRQQIAAQNRALQSTFIASPAVRDAQAQGRLQTGVLNAQAKAATAAAAATKRLSVGMGALAGMGLGATAALAAVTIAIGAAINEWRARTDFRNRIRDLTGEFNEDGSKKTEEEKKEEYVGPYADEQRKEQERRQGPVAGFMRSIEEFYSAPFNGTLFDSADEMEAKRKQWEQGFNEEVQRRIDATKAEVIAIMATIDGADGLADGKRDVYEFVDGGWQVKGAPESSEKDVLEASDKARSALVEQRKALLDQYKAGSISDQEYGYAMGQIEEQDKALNDWAAAQLMKARGFASRDNLSGDLLKNIDQLRPLLLQIQGMGLSDEVMGALDSLVQDTGVPEDSKAGKIIARLAEGNLTRVEALRDERSLIEIELANAQAKFEAATAGDVAMEPEEIEALGQQVQSYIQALAGKTGEIISAFVESSTALANLAANEGKYGQARDQIQAAMAGIAAELESNPDLSPEVRAQYQQQYSSLASQSAGYAVQGKNERLKVAQAFSQNAMKDARLDAQIAQNTFQALQQERANAQAAGQQGPPLSALRDAKIAWITAEQSLASLASQANIAAMTATAAGLWNGIASAQAGEEIALAQYNAAVAEFGANSTQALGALASYTSAQHSTTTTMDQVQAAQNEAVLASIPQGNAVAVAQQGVRNAQAALAAAKKYGTNSVEYQNALAQLYSAQQQVSSATAAVAQAQVGVAIAIADAAGNTVKSAQLQLTAARLALSAAVRNGGAASAEALQARAGVISAQAALRDAKLQDELDTIDFNLEMGRITQSSALKALREILRTTDLTKQQRRDLMLQIKGMEEEMSEGPWNFGDIKLPKPYLMKRYMAEMRENNTANAQSAVQDAIGRDRLYGLGAPGGKDQNYGYVDQRQVNVTIEGGNLAEVRRVVMEVVGRPTKTRTVAPRRGRG
jgi:hypothetical protein